MTFVYRILRKAFCESPFDGEGAYRFGGRWSSPGIRLAYTSEHASLAMLEYLTHINRLDLPPDLVLVTAEVPETVPRIVVKKAQLPDNWRETPTPPELAAFGDRFVNANRACALVVPSALSPGESNWLINPEHSSFRKVRVRPPEPFQYDPRLL